MIGQRKFFIALWRSNMVGCVQVVRIYSFMREIKVYIWALYIIFLFKTENNNFIKEIKHVLRASIAWWKPLQSLWQFSSKWKPSTTSRVFTDLLSNSPKRLPWFSPEYEGTENMFCFLNNSNNSIKNKNAGRFNGSPGTTWILFSRSVQQ